MIAASASSIKITLMKTVFSKPFTSLKRMPWFPEPSFSWSLEGSTSPAIILRTERPRRLEAMTASSVARVITPIPPTWRATNTIRCPAGDQWVAMSSVVRPVTQMAEVAVKRASASGVASPLAAAKGIINRPVVTPTRKIKTTTVVVAAWPPKSICRRAPRPRIPGGRGASERVRDHASLFVRARFARRMMLASHEDTFARSLPDCRGDNRQPWYSSPGRSTLEDYG